MISAKQGLFITLEGGEGSGKSTLITHLETHLKNLGYEVVITREPGGTSLGELVRKWLLDPSLINKVSEAAELFLFLAARAQHIDEKITPALKQGKVVICDRFNDSTIAYQGAARKLGIEYVTQLCDMVCKDSQPQLTFLLDISPEIGLNRSRLLSKENAGQGELDRIEIENLEFHQNIRKAFLDLAKKNSGRIQIIDAHQSLEKVSLQATKIVERYL